MSHKRNPKSAGRFVPLAEKGRTKEHIPHPGYGDAGRANTPTRVIGQEVGRSNPPHGEIGRGDMRGEVIGPKADQQFHGTGTISVGSTRINAERVREGLPMRALDDLAKKLQVDRADLANILGTSLRTLQRKEEASSRLGPAASDRLARVARILDLAVHVFGEVDKASIWLTSESRALENEIPLHMLDTDIGTERVQRELRQIEFGMPF